MNDLEYLDFFIFSSTIELLQGCGS